MYASMRNHNQIFLGTGGKKNRQKERRLMKGFNIAPPPGSSSTTSLPPVAELIASLQLSEHSSLPPSHELFGSTLSGLLGSTPGLTMRRTYTGPKDNIQPNHHGLTKLVSKRNSSRKRKWDSLIEATRLGKVGRLINRSRSEDSVCNSKNGEGRNSQSPLSDENNLTDTDSNPSLVENKESSGSLSILKHKRKIFSTSRNPQGEAGSSLDSKDHKSYSKQLKRASSVPTRVVEPVLPAKHEQTQSQQQSVDIQQQGMLTPSTTEESVTPGAAGNDTNGSSVDIKNRNGLVTVLPNLGIQPLSGHNVSAGWL